MAHEVSYLLHANWREQYLFPDPFSNKQKFESQVMVKHSTNSKRDCGSMLGL